MANKVGRPTKKLDKDMFEGLCSFQCTQEEMANFFKMSVDTLDRRVKETYGQNFAEIYKIKRLGGIMSLRRKLFSTAMKGDKTLLIWLDKKYAHLQGDVDQRVYGVHSDEHRSKDHKVDINVTFTDMPDKCVAEVAEVEKIKRED